MYNAHYQGYSPPSPPKVITVSDHEKVTIFEKEFFLAELQPLIMSFDFPLEEMAISMSPASP